MFWFSVLVIIKVQCDCIECAVLFRYVSLSDNEKTGFRARELKSVHVDAVGSYLKLTFHRNHVNQYNIYNQVQIHVHN